MKFTIVFFILNLIWPLIGYTQFSDEVVLSTRNQSLNNIQNIDFDLDGQIDIVVVAEQMGKISWYKNMGGGIFSSEREVINGGQGDFHHYEISDFDQDGDLDIIAPSESTHKIILLENDGTMIFNNIQVITTNVDSPRYIEIKDLDNDSDLDLISTSENKIAWYENLGGGVFGSQQVLSISAAYPEHCVSADLDNDGDNDIIFAETVDGRIYLIENFGNGSFGPIQSIASSIPNFKDLRLRDIDNDNLVDIAYAFGGNSYGGVAWIKNLGGNSFQAAQMMSSISTGAISLELADLDNDTDIDIVYGINGNFVNGNIDSIVVLLNDGNQNFSISDVASYYSAQVSEPSSIAVSDLDGDGIPDVSTTSSGGVNRATWYKQIGPGQLGTENQLFNEINGPYNTLSEDIDLDGLPDLIVVSSKDNKISWYKNAGNGQYDDQQLIGYTPLLSPLDLGIDDFNNDGNPDIVVCGWYQDIYYFENSGGGNFNSGVVVGQDSLRSHDMHISDLNGDGESDIIIGSRIDNELAWYQGFGNGTFGARNVVTNTVVGVENIWSSDLDNDGDMDLIAAEYLGNRISWWANDGTGNFPSSAVIDQISTPNGLTVADLNGDGNLDVLSTSELNNSIVWYENYGTGSFSELKLIDSDAFEAADVRAADMDNDGDIDVVSTSSSPVSQQGISWYENLGNGQFAMASIIVDSVFSCSSIHLNDFDLDGDQDLAYTSHFGDQLSYLLNYAIDNRQVRGQLYIDVNTNQQYDSNDLSFSQIGVNSSPISSNSYIYNDGRYFVKLLDTTIYTISPGNLSNWSVYTDSIDYSINADVNFSFEDSLDFGFYPSQFIDSIDLDGVGGLPRCNDTVNYWINIENLGTSRPSGIICIELDDSLTYIDASLTPDSIIGNNIYWSYDSLMYFSSSQIQLQVKMPDFNSIGDTLINPISLSVLDGNGITVYTVMDTLEQLNICAYDPNDKQSKPAGIDTPGYIDPSTSSLEYTIRFQNTGNDTAMVVVIKDQLQTDLNWSSFEVLSSSHAMTHDLSSTGEVTFSFSNIKLPDSTTDFLGSQGYVKFQIDLLSGLPLGTEISNSAAIYFDLNPPIITNTKLNTLFDCKTLFSLLPSNSLCKNETFVFDPGVSGTTIDWDITGIDSGIDPEISWSADTVGTFNITMHAMNAICSYDSTVTITVHPLPSLNILDTVILCYGDSSNIFSQWQNTTGLYTMTETSVNGCDSIIATQLNVLPEIDTTWLDTVTSCNSYTWSVNNQTYTQSGQYIEILINNDGCDSTVTLNLTIDTVNNLITQLDDITLEADAANAQYQWVNCDQNYQVIPGETNQSFQATENGEYAVIVTQNGCTDTTDCINIDKVGLDENTKETLKVYPNPTSNSFTISSDVSINSGFKIIDSQGKEVLTGKIDGKEQIIDISKLSTGAYSVVFDDSGLPVLSVIKE